MSADQAQQPADADARVGWPALRHEARERLRAAGFSGSMRILDLVGAVVDAPHMRANWAEGGAMARIFRNDPEKIERELARIPELTEQHVGDALLLIDEARDEFEALDRILRWYAGDRGFPAREITAAEAVQRLGRLAERRRAVDDDEREFMRAARAAGVSWDAIGVALGYAPSSARQSAYRRAKAIGLGDLIGKEEVTSNAADE